MSYVPEMATSQAPEARKLNDGPSASPWSVEQSHGKSRRKKKNILGALLSNHFQARESPRHILLEAFNFACQRWDLI